MSGEKIMASEKNHGIISAISNFPRSIKKLTSLFLLAGLVSCGDEKPAIELNGLIEDSPLGYSLNKTHALDKLLLKITASAPIALDRVTVEVAEERPSGTKVCSAAGVGKQGDAVHLEKGESVAVPIYNCYEHEITKITLVTWDGNIEYVFNPESVELYLAVAFLSAENSEAGRATKISFNIVPEPIPWSSRTDDIKINEVNIKGGQCALSDDIAERINAGYTLYEGETEFIEITKCNTKTLEEVTIVTLKRKYTWVKQK